MSENEETPEQMRERIRREERERYEREQEERERVRQELTAQQAPPETPRRNERPKESAEKDRGILHRLQLDVASKIAGPLATNMNLDEGAVAERALKVARQLLADTGFIDAPRRGATLQHGQSVKKTDKGFVVTDGFNEDDRGQI